MLWPICTSAAPVAGQMPGMTVPQLGHLPSGVTFVSATSSEGSYSSSTGAWTIGTLAANATATLEIAATAIYADTMEAARNPRGEGSVGVLHEVFEKDRAGRTISKFYGDAEVTWAPFKSAARRVTGVRTKFDA